MLLLASPAALLADVKLTFDVTRHITQTAKPSLPAAAPVTKKSTVTVFLGENYVRSISEAETAHTDFVRRRTHRLLADGKTFTDMSLYADLGFRTAELRNRQKLAAALKSISPVPPDAVDPVLAAHSLAVSSPASSPLAASVGTDETSYLHNGRLLASYTLDGFTLNQAESAHFVRYLRHHVRAHPDILAALEKLHTAPRQFSVVHYDTGMSRSEFTLVASERVAEPASLATILVGREPRPADSLALRAALALTPATFNTRGQDLRQTAIKAGKSKQPLDALLLFIEFTLSTGEPLPKEFAAYKTAIQADPDCRQFLSTRGSTNATEARRAAETLSDLESKTTLGLPVLKILRANLLTELGKPGEAQPLLLAALEASPHIVGAWRDIGFGYHNAYQMEVAWQWWDAARRLQPASQTVKPIDDLERKLAQDHPDFF